MPEQRLLFEQWANFFVATSAAAATLLGLLFVLVALAAERGRKDTADLRIYLTPVVIYFSSVLGTSALLIVPNQTRLSAVTCICLAGIVGMGYCGSMAIRRGGVAPHTENVPTSSPMSCFRSPHTPLWSLAAWCCFKGPQPALTW